MKISELTSIIRPYHIEGEGDCEITNITTDSRAVKPGALFIAVRGTQTDGHTYINQAIQKGAVAILCEQTSPGGHVVNIQVESTKELVGPIASYFYGNPSSKLKLIGVTGTNGKTTVATLLYQLFKKVGEKVGLLSTVCNYIDEKRVEATHTTPDPISLNKLLAEMVSAGCSLAFMEVSSHAIDQQRIAGLKFVGGIFTNLTRDHLDYHKTTANYIKAKKQFFDHLPKEAFCLINKDDKNGMVMTQNTKASIFSFSLRNRSDYKGRILESHFDGSLLVFDDQELFVQFIGEFNAYNLLTVYGAARLLGLEKEETLIRLSELQPVSGRFESFKSKQGYTVIVDYAHTPDAINNVLSSVHNILEGEGRVITVVGAGGNRDKGKRPIMAQKSVKQSDQVIFTSDNPRNEDPQAIVEDMLSGLTDLEKRKTISILNRKEAIKTACLLAQPNDVVVIVGKGHETYQEIKGVKHHFDDKEEVLAIINA